MKKSYEGDPDVLGQAHGCCLHGHPILSINLEDDGSIVIHV